MWQYNYTDELYHFGVKGMKWGQRKTQHQAKKDAKEYARAKMFYGEGAGNRRKLIKAQVEERSKDPVYKKAFDDNLAKQDMAKHATKAKSERMRKDIKNSTAKTARGLINSAKGNIARASAASAAIYMVAKATGADKKVAAAVKSGASVAKVKASSAYTVGKAYLYNVMKH